MMRSADWDGVFVADLAAERVRLGEPDVILSRDLATWPARCGSNAAAATKCGPEAVGVKASQNGRARRHRLEGGWAVPSNWHVKLTFPRRLSGNLGERERTRCGDPVDYPTGVGLYFDSARHARR